MKNTNNRTYSELITMSSFLDRYEYLRLGGKVGEETYGYERYINQSFYRSRPWLNFRDNIIIRDNGCDLGVEGYEIIGEIIIVHHLNPITADDIKSGNPSVLDSENVICVRFSTHNALHYGDNAQLIMPVIERRKNDTCPWKAKNR